MVVVQGRRHSAEFKAKVPQGIDAVMRDHESVAARQVPEVRRASTVYRILTKTGPKTVLTMGYTIDTGVEAPGS